MNILVVDDDPQILSFLKRGLAYEGHSVVVAQTGEEALAKAREHEPDLVILDVMMPGLDGNAVCRRLRESSVVPVLMLTAKGTVADKVQGLDSGADDYLVKPFSFDELSARIRALERRHKPLERKELHFGDLTMDLGSHEVLRSGRSVELTQREFDLLELLLRHPRQVMTRDVIYEHVWGYDFGGESNIIEVYIRYLRAKLEAGGLPRLIHTVRGIGYVLKE